MTIILSPKHNINTFFSMLLQVKKAALIVLVSMTKNLEQQFKKRFFLPHLSMLIWLCILHPQSCSPSHRPEAKYRAYHGG